MSSARTINLQDVGPIERLPITFPEGGGIVVLRGANGSGKSLALKSVQALVEGGGKVPSRDGSIGAQVTGLGVRLTLGRRATVSGELEVPHLEGEDPSLLVDPGIKTEAAADGARIKALLRLSRAKVDAGKFAELVGGDAELRELCSDATLTMVTDVPAMAAAIKRDFEGAARKEEARAENLATKAAGIRAMLTEMGGPVALRHGSAEEARAAHTAAVREHAAAEATRDQARKLREAGDQASATLDRMGNDGTAAALADAAMADENALASVDAARARVTAAQQELAAAKSALAEADAAQLRTVRDHGHQQRFARQRVSLQSAIDAAAGAKVITNTDIDALAAQVNVTAVEVEAWAVRDKTAAARASVEALDRESHEASEKARVLRAAAHGTERVVLEAVSAVCPEGMEIKDGRLYMRTDRGLELFSELSHGERWRIAIETSTKAVKASGDAGLLVIGQEGFASLQPAIRKEIAEHARRLNVVIVTAECDDGVLRSEVFAPGATIADTNLEASVGA
jgi:hypothetical protein